MRELALYLVVIVAAASVAVAQRGVDILMTGTLLSGEVTFFRDAQEPDPDFVIFKVGRGREYALVRLRESLARNSRNVSSAWYRLLLGGGKASLRFAEKSDAEPSALNPLSVAFTVVCGPPRLEEREVQSAAYSVHCMSVDVNRWPKDEAGREMTELTILVATLSGSELDQRLAEHAVGQAPILARIEK